MHSSLRLLIVVAGALLAVTGCSTTQTQSSSRDSVSPFTHGNVTLNLRKGATSQLEVLNTFGAPNIATVNSKGNEVWTYQKNAQITSGSSSEGYLTVILAGAAKSNTRFEETSRSMTLIIHFDENKIVDEFMSRYFNF